MLLWRGVRRRVVMGMVKQEVRRGVRREATVGVGLRRVVKSGVRRVAMTATMMGMSRGGRPA